jgi:LysR family hydrogen peroxide-inducible transcriptional activator
MALWGALPFSLRQLQYLVAVAELGGFRKAAEACGIAQPSLSTQIALVEGALGVQIFERSARGVRVSAAGTVVIDRARAVLLAAADLTRAAREQGDPLRGTIRLGVIPTVCPYLLPEIAAPLRRALPDLTVQWVEDKTRALLQQLEAGALDGVIVAVDGRIAHLEQALLGDDPFVLAAAPGHRLAKARGPASTSLLAGATVLLLEDGHCFRDQALALCGAAGAHPADLKATGLSTLVQMVSSGEGVTLLPRLAVPVENRRGQLAVRAFTAPAPMRRLVMAWRTGTALKPSLEAVASAIRKAWPKTR